MSSSALLKAGGAWWKTKPCRCTIDTVSGILQLGGTILRTSRTNPRKMEGGIDKCLASIKANQLDALITIGGDDTQGVANALVAKGHQGSGRSQDHR